MSLDRVAVGADACPCSQHGLMSFAAKSDGLDTWTIVHQSDPLAEKGL